MELSIQNNEAAGCDPGGFNNQPPATAHSGFDWFIDNVTNDSEITKDQTEIYFTVRTVPGQTCHPG